MLSSYVDQMKRVLIDHFGGPEVVSVVEDDDPQPAQGQARVRVLASGVSLSGLARNFGDVFVGAVMRRA